LYPNLQEHTSNPVELTTQLWAHVLFTEQTSFAEIKDKIVFI